MSDTLPQLDPYAAANDPAAQNQFNELLIEQSRTNAGTVTGQFTGLPVLVLLSRSYVDRLRLSWR